jgi:hypothetical protein
MSGLMSGSRCGRSAPSYVELKVQQGKGKRGQGTVQCGALLALKLLSMVFARLCVSTPRAFGATPRGKGVDTQNRAGKAFGCYFDFGAETG